MDKVFMIVCVLLTGFLYEFGLYGMALANAVLAVGTAAYIIIKWLKFPD